MRLGRPGQDGSDKYLVNLRHKTMARSKSLNGVFDRLTCPDEAQIMRQVRRIGRMNQVGYLTNIIVGRERPDEPVRTVQVVALVIQTRVDCPQRVRFGHRWLLPVLGRITTRRFRPIAYIAAAAKRT